MLDLSDITSDWEVPDLELPDLNFEVPENQKVDIFEISKRKKWHSISSEEARCDMKPCIRLTKRGVFFISVWKKSLFGRTLTDLKSDRDMVSVFADAIVPVITGVLGSNLDPEQFAVICSPRRRHLDWNFGHEAAQAVASSLGLQFFPDSCTARSRQRVNVDFEPANIPSQRNLIVYDDIVTTGQTLSSMYRLFSDKLHKNCLFFSNINNKL